MYRDDSPNFFQEDSIIPKLLLSTSKTDISERRERNEKDIMFCSCSYSKRLDVDIAKYFSLNISNTRDQSWKLPSTTSASCYSCIRFLPAHMIVERYILIVLMSLSSSLLIKYKIDILGISETWLTNQITDVSLNIPGYEIVRVNSSSQCKNHDVVV